MQSINGFLQINFNLILGINLSKTSVPVQRRLSS